MYIINAGYAFVEGCVVRIDSEAGATGGMVCTIIYIEDEERRAQDTYGDGVLCRLLATNDSLERPVLSFR